MVVDLRRWLDRLSSENTSTEDDDKRMQSVLRLLGFSKAVCICGIAYIMGEGETIDIHTLAKKLKEALEGGKR